MRQDPIAKAMRARLPRQSRVVGEFATWSLAAAVVLSLASCDALDGLLEDRAPAETFLRIAWPAPEVSVTLGDSRVVPFVVTRLDGYDRAVSVTIHGLPQGATSSIAVATQGEVITNTITFDVAATVSIGDHPFRMVVHGERLHDSEREMTLRVLAQPSYDLSVQPAEIQVVRGGVAPVVITADRLNFTDPIALSIDADATILATFTPNPVASNSAHALVSVGADVTPGTHAVTIHGSPAPVDDTGAELVVVVLPDDIQVLTDDTIATWQGRIARQNIIVNARPGVGAVSLAADGLPSLVEATFSEATSNQSTMTLDVSPLVPPGAYPIVVRATAEGVSDATANLVLEVKPSGIAVTLIPASLPVFQGARAVGRVAIERLDLDTTVIISVENAPAGLDVASTPSVVSGAEASLDISAATETPPGVHDITIVATPSGWPAEAGTRTVLPINVRPAPSGSGNVILDWTQCTAPAWAAYQDGDGPWTRVLPENGAARISVASGRAGVAFTSDDSLVVRLLSQAELTDLPEDMCPARRFSRSVFGSGVHDTEDEQFRYGFGGGTATSTAENPQFMIGNVSPGVHDLVAWGTNIPFGTRALIRRKLDIPDGGSLGAVSLTGSESFPVQEATLSLAGFSPGDALTVTMNYLTGLACTISPLYSSTATADETSELMPIPGMPSARRAPEDYHLLAASVAKPDRVLTVTTSFQTLTNRTLAFGQVIAAPSVAVETGAYLRLRLTTGSYGFMAQTYNRFVALSYSSDGNKVALHVSKSYLGGASSLDVATPDFSAVPGWQDHFAPPAGSSGSWAVTFVGGATGSPCAPGYTVNTARYSGAY